MNSLIINYFIASIFILHTSKDRAQHYSAHTFCYFLNDSIPSWVRQLYETPDSALFENATAEVIFFKPLTDTTSYSLYTVSTGTCFRTYVATQKNRQHYTSLNISEECDEELSEPEYSRTTYSHDSARRAIVLTFDTEKANPKYLVKTGNMTVFKKGYDMDSGKTMHHITKKTVVITKSGNLKFLDKNSR